MAVLTCQNCGDVLGEGEMYCAKCGTKLGDTSPPPKPPRPKSAAGLLILAVLMFLLAAGSIVATIVLTAQSPRPIQVDPNRSKIPVDPADYAAYALYMMQEAIPLVDGMEQALYERPNRVLIEAQVSQVSALLADFLQFRSPPECADLAAYMETFSNDLYIFNFLVETAFAPPTQPPETTETETESESSAAEGEEETGTDDAAPEIPGEADTTQPEEDDLTEAEESSTVETTAPLFLTARIPELAQSLRDQYYEAEYNWEALFPGVPHPTDVQWPQESAQLREGYAKDLTDFVTHVNDLVRQVERARREVRPESFISSRNQLLDEIEAMWERTAVLYQRMLDNMDDKTGVFEEILEVFVSLDEIAATYVTDADDYMKYGMEVYSELVEKDLEEMDMVLALLSTYSDQIRD